MTLKRMIKKAFATNDFQVSITNHNYKYAITNTWGKLKILQNNVKCQLLVSDTDRKAGAFLCKINGRKTILQYNDERIEQFI